MNIKIAEEKDFDDVKKITRETIMEIYPMYYPHGAVLFFAEHHSDENIMRDIRTGIVYLLISDEGIPVGTVTLTNNEIDRLFVLPSFQHRGYGRTLMDMAEEKISSAYDVIVLHASLPAKSIYLIGVWGVINLLEGYGSDNASAKSQGIKQLMPSLM